jgi:hypothetical protein
VGRATVDGLVDERIDSLIHTASRIRDCERFHSQEYTKHLFAAARTMSRP